MDNMNEKETSDIQNYLESFNKEIECDELEDDSSNENDQASDVEYGNSKTIFPYTSGDEIEDENHSEITVKIENDDSDYFYNNGYSNEKKNENNVSKVTSPETKKKTAEIIRLGSKGEKTSKEEISFSDNNETVVPMVEELHIDDHRTLEMVAQFAEQAAKASDDNDLLGAYQTVTVVPSDTNPGELSYVLFVSEAGTCSPKDGEDMDVALYDLNGNEAFDEAFLSKQISADRVKMRTTIRLSTRRNPLNNYRNCTQQHVCNFCSYTSNKRYLLSRHMKSHSDERPHKCGVCERGFKTLASLQNHVNTHTGTRPHPCKECDSCFTTSGELVRHVRYKHTHEKPHKCTECDYASVELSKLKRHMRCHTGERPYQCPHCTYASPDTYKLKRHLRIHTGEKPYECDICQTRFTQSNSLKAHKLIHSGNKPVFHCEYCPATCGRKTDLRIHMEKLHSSDNPHKCNRCGKIFLDRYSYKIHIKSHEGEKCFKCDLCNYASISQRHLETHMFVHTDQKPFQCDECDQSFRQKQLLKRHKNIYHDPNYVRPQPKVKPHVCILCSKAFRHRGNLVRHFALHDPDATLVERAAAMRLGESKNSGDDQDEDEDAEAEGDVDYLNDPEKQDQQVVVFEVIQLPSSGNAPMDEQAVTLIDSNTLMLNGSDTQGYSIIEAADDSVNNFLAFNESVSDSEDVENISASPVGNSPLKIRSGRLSKLNLASKKRQKSIESPEKLNENKRISRKPRILKVVAEKKKVVKEPTLIEELPDKDASLHKGKDLSRDFNKCFDSGNKEDDDDDDDEGGFLTMATDSDYQSFHSTHIQENS